MNIGGVIKKSSSSYYFVVCFCIFAVLSALTAVSGLALSSSPSHAETSSVLASVTVPDVCTLSAGTGSTAHTATVEVGTYTQGIGETILNVLCNDNNGYSIYAVGYSNNTVGNTNLIGTTNGATIPTGTSTTTGSNAVSNWAMKLTAVNGTFPATILDSYDSYHVVPSTATKVATRTSSIDLSADSKIKTTYAVSISPAQTADSYVGKVKYTVVHPNYTNADGTLESYPVTLSFGANTSSIIIDGTTYTSSSATPNLEYGTHTISGTFPEGYKLNSWSSTGNITISSTTSNPTSISVTGTGTLSVSAKVDCTETTFSGYMQALSASTVTNACVNDSGTLTDRRDNKTYTVKKLADGKLWMTENLAIDLTATSYDTLYGTGTNAGKMTNATSQALGYLKGTTTGTASDQWAMAAVKKTWTSSYSYSEPWIAVDSSTSGICYTPTTWCVDTSGNGAWSWDTVTPATINGTTSIAQGKIGVYYNYCAASAGSYCWGNGTDYTDSPSSDPNASSSRDIISDICPYGWHLPTNTPGEFRDLYNTYSSNVTNIQTALSTPLSGRLVNSRAYDQGSGGYFWSSTWGNSSGMCYLYVSSTSVNLWSVHPRIYGYSARCVFGS